MTKTIMREEMTVQRVRDNVSRRREIWIIVILLLLCYPLFFHKLGDRDIWSPDEDEYVQVNREMVLDGHWIYPTANGRPYSIKPPLFNWIGSAFAVINGEVTEYTSRLPSAIAAAAGLLILYYFGRMMFGYRSGLLSALILGTTPLYIEFGRWIQINMISTVLLTATLGLFYWGYRSERSRTLAYLLMYIPAGLGTLNMGLVNIAMPVVVIGVYLIILRDIKHILQMKIGWGILIYLAIVAPWYIAVSLRGEYAQNLIIVTNFSRYFTEWAHVRPFYYYLSTTPPYFLPWFFFLPGALYLCFSQKTKIDKRHLLFLFIWVVGLFIFFSLSKTKRSEYVLPIFPAMALLVGYLLDRGLRAWEESPFWRRLIQWPALISFCTFMAAGVALTIYGASLSKNWLFILLPLSLCSLFGAALAFWLFQRGKRMLSICTIFLIIVLSVFYGVGPVVAKKNENDSAKPFCVKVQRYLNPGEKLKMYRFYRPVYSVYTERFLDMADHPATLAKWFDSEKPVYVVTKEKEYLKIKDSLPRPIYVIIREWIDHRYVLLISNFPAPQTVPGGNPSRTR